MTSVASPYNVAVTSDHFEAEFRFAIPLLGLMHLNFEGSTLLRNVVDFLPLDTK